MGIQHVRFRVHDLPLCVLKLVFHVLFSYVECVALLPQVLRAHSLVSRLFLNAVMPLAQILMLRSRANAIETSDHRAQYVACLFFSRLLEGS